MTKKIQISNPARELDEIKDFNQHFIKQIKSGFYVGGENVDLLEKSLANFLETKYVVTLNSGTDALNSAIYALNISEGDEVILPSFTFFATAEAVINRGATIVFADIDEETYSIDLKNLIPLVNSKTKCIIPVHLYGNNADIENISEFCKNNKINLIEDCAQAFGSKTPSGKYLGTFGEINAFSNYPSKTLGGIGDGGFIATNSKKHYDLIKKYKNHGQAKNYEHEISGINSRMDSINAFTLNQKLRMFNKIKESRDELVQFYNSFLMNFDSVIVPKFQPNLLYNYYTIQLSANKRNNIMEDLQYLGISTSIYYKKPLHMQKAIKNYGYKFDDLSNTEFLSKRVLSLPLFPFMHKNEKSLIKKSITKVLKLNDIN